MMNVWEISHIDDIVSALKAGEVVAIPTDTVYGFATVVDEVAIQKLYEAKNRKNNPIAILASDIDAIEEIGFLASKDKLLIDSFMPGAFTLVIKKNDWVPDLLTNGLPTVGVRIPDHEITLRILKEFKYLAVTSANISGEPPLLNYNDVVSKFEGRINGVVVGDVKISVASTVVNACDGYKVLREGVINKSQIEDVLNQSKEELV